MIYLYCKYKLNEICWNALNTTSRASYYVVIILANLLLSLIQESILRYIRKKKKRRERRKSTYIADLNHITPRQAFRSNLKRPHVELISINSVLFLT